jgi:hypothetical protein
MWTSCVRFGMLHGEYVLSSHIPTISSLHDITGQNCKHNTFLTHSILSSSTLFKGDARTSPTGRKETKHNPWPRFASKVIFPGPLPVVVFLPLLLRRRPCFPHRHHRTHS